VKARAKWSAVVLMVTAISVIAAPAFAAQGHPDCAAKQHDCGKASRIVSCCCDGRGESSTPSGPVELRAHVTPNLTVTPAVIATSDCPRLPAATTEIRTSPPRTAPPDLPTLFASLLL